MKKNRNLKITLILMSVVFLLAFALIAGSIAYRLSNDHVSNEIVIGYSDVEFSETFESPDELTIGANVYDLNISTDNTGYTASYVRVFIAFEDSDIEAITGFSLDGEIYYSATKDGVSSITTREDIVGDDPDLADFAYTESYLDHLPSGWVYISEEDNATLGGYLYYTEPMAINGSVPSPIESAMTYFSTEDDITEFNIFVYAECVQARNLDGTDYTGDDAYLQAWTDYLTEN